MNILVDTNVLISAVLRDRLPEQVVRFIATSPDCRWIVTSDILNEYVDVLRRPKFGIDDAILREWEALLETRTVLTANPPSTVELPRDPKDAKFLAAAIASEANYLITGDKDLLETDVPIATRILSASDFAEEFGLG